MRKPIAPVAIALFAVALGSTGCAREATAPATSNATDMVADDQAIESMNDVVYNISNDVDVTSANANGEDPGPRSQSGSQPDQSRPKNKIADQ